MKLYSVAFKFTLHDMVRIQLLDGIPGRVVAIHLPADGSWQYLIRYKGDDNQVEQTYFYEDELVGLKNVE